MTTEDHSATADSLGRIMAELAAIRALLDQPKKREWLTAEEACEHMGISYESLHKYKRLYGLPHHRVGGRLKFKAAQLDRWMESNDALLKRGRA
jgi:excisionase family DNA binding protein